MVLTLVKNLTLLTLPDSQRLSVRTKRQFISISIVRHRGPASAYEISRDQSVQSAPWQAAASCQFVLFGWFRDADFIAIGTQGNVVCNSHGMNTCTKMVGVPLHLCAPTQARSSSTMCGHISKALRGFAVASRVLREVIGSASSSSLWRQSSEQHQPNTWRLGSAGSNFVQFEEGLGPGRRGRDAG
jgi:hypothetical protein